MSELLGYGIAAGLIIAWTVVLYVLQGRGLLEKYHLHPSGPFLMWKTERGREFLDRLARPKRFWRAFGDAGILIVAVTSAATTLLLIWEATIVSRPEVRQNAPSPQLLLGLPGINPLIPLWYGIFGLAIAIVLHEFAHGVLSRVANVRIRSLGGIFLLVPMGAFVEPEEEEMKALPRRQRARLYAVGPATNMILAVIFAVLFSTMTASSLAPIQRGIGIVDFATEKTECACSPALEAGMARYMVITSVNGTSVTNGVAFRDAIAQVQPGQIVIVEASDGVSIRSFNVNLTAEQGTGRPLLGIFAFDTNTDFFHPFSNSDRFGGVPGSILVYISLPFQGRAPIQEPATYFYRIEGPWAAVPAPLYYLIANVLYWLFWLNVMLGATNALPAIPLDGGYMFKDGVDALVSRVKKGIGTEARDRISKRVSYFFALFILALIVWQIIGPRIPIP